MPSLLRGLFLLLIVNATKFLQYIVLKNVFLYTIIQYVVFA